MPKPSSDSFGEHSLSAAKDAAIHAWRAVRELNEAVESIKSSALLSEMSDDLEAHFDSLSSTLAKIEIWIERNDRQLEIPNAKHP